MNLARSFVRLGLALAIASTVTAASAVDAIAYRGQVLQAADGKPPSIHVPFLLEFRLYKAETGGAALWGRQMPVKINADGTFYLELTDGAGSPLTDAAYTRLAQAAAASPDALWISLKPVDGTETSRDRIAAQPFAFRASTAAAVDTVTCETLDATSLSIVNGTTLDHLAFAGLSQSPSSRVNVVQPSGSQVTLTTASGRASVKVGAIAGITHRAGQNSAATADTMLLRSMDLNRGNVQTTYSTLIFPAGSSLGGEGSAVSSMTFGK